MTITNLTAKENNGVVVAEFEAFGGKVKVQVNKTTIVDTLVMKYTPPLASIDDVLKIKENVTFWVNNNLVAEVGSFINFNLQEAE